MRFVTILLSLALLFSCSATESESVACGEGESKVVEGAQYCVYQRAVVIEEGFSCPPDMILYDMIDEDVVVCGPNGGAEGAVAAARDSQAESMWSVAEPVELTFRQHIGPLLQQECGDCHQPDGPLADMSDFAVVAANLDAVMQQIETGAMPAWTVTNDGSCSVFPHAAGLSERERGQILAWVNQGAPEGDANIEYETPRRVQADIDATVANAELTAGTSRCFALQVLADDTDITAVRALVTDDIDYLGATTVSAQDAPRVQMLDAADPLPGFDCTERPPAAGYLVAGWTRGPREVFYPEGFGAPIASGQLIMLRVGVRTNTTVDRLGFEFETGTSTVEIRGLPLQVENLVVPSGQPSAASVIESTGSMFAGGPIRIHGFLLSGKSRLTSLQISVVREDQSTDCALRRKTDVFRDWAPMLFPTLPVDVGPNDVLRLRCEFDTTGDTQAVRAGTLADSEVCRVGLMVEDL